MAEKNKIDRFIVIFLYCMLLITSSRTSSIMAEDRAYNMTTTCYISMISQHTRHIETMLVKCWVCVADGGSTLNQR